MKKQVIIVAGGKGLRMGVDIPKQFLLLDGRPILMHTIEAFYNYDCSIDIIVVIPEDQHSFWRNLCDAYKFDIKHLIVAGGETRFHSVKNGLKFVDECSLVAIHDGVRALVTKDIIARTYDVAERCKMACPAISLTDSLRRILNGKNSGVDRSAYCLVQTPQVFISNKLLCAYQQDYSDEFTDDVSVVEAHRRCRPMLVEGSPENIKITTPLDLAIAETIIKLRAKNQEFEIMRSAEDIVLSNS